MGRKTVCLEVSRAWGRSPTSQPSYFYFIQLLGDNKYGQATRLCRGCSGTQPSQHPNTLWNLQERGEERLTGGLWDLKDHNNSPDWAHCAFTKPGWVAKPEKLSFPYLCMHVPWFFHPILKVTEWNVYGLISFCALKTWKVQIRGFIYLGLSENR